MLFFLWGGSAICAEIAIFLIRPSGFGALAAEALLIASFFIILLIVFITELFRTSFRRGAGHLDWSWIMIYALYAVFSITSTVEVVAGDARQEQREEKFKKVSEVRFAKFADAVESIKLGMPYDTVLALCKKSHLMIVHTGFMTHLILADLALLVDLTLIQMKNWFKRH